MRYLTLIRHAKSSWKDSSLPDIRRPLSRRGKRDGPAMGARLARGGFQADLILSSPATRARATAKLIAAEVAYPAEEIAIDERIYEASLEDLIDIVAGIENGVRSVILVGHNPGLNELVDFVSPDLLGNLPTCGIVRFGFELTPWSDVLETEPKETEFDSPREAGLR